MTGRSTEQEYGWDPHDGQGTVYDANPGREPPPCEVCGEPQMDGMAGLCLDCYRKLPPFLPLMEPSERMKWGKRRVNRVGNAVVPQVAEWIGRRILDGSGDAEARRVGL